MARHVDVIHTSVGTKIPSGHLDFYLSLGENKQLHLLEDSCQGDRECLDMLGCVAFAYSFSRSPCIKMSLCTDVEMGKSHEFTFIYIYFPKEFLFV